MVEAYITSKGYKILEGGSDHQQLTWMKEWLWWHPNTKHILEVGFNAGTWCEALLEASKESNPTLHITSMDLGRWDYTAVGKTYIDATYPGRHTLILGDSTETIPKLTRKYDLIFIDGGHAGDVPYLDLLNCKELAYPWTTVILDDFDNYHGKEVKTCWDRFNAEGFLKEGVVEARGEPGSHHEKRWWVGKYRLTRIVIINAYNRAEYLGRCLENLSKSEDLEKWSIIYHQDGLPNGGYDKATADVANKWLDICSKRCPYVYKHFYTENKNIGVRQYDAIIDAFYNKKADYLCVMEDDLVPSKTYLKTLYNLLNYTTDESVAYVGGNYWNDHPEQGDEKTVIVATPLAGNYQSTWMTGHHKFKFKQMMPYYTQGHDLIFKNRPYQPGWGKESWTTYLQHWDAVFKQLDLGEHNNCYCQDALQLYCYRKAGFNSVAFPLTRHALPIGKEGLHFNKEIFDKSGLDDTSDDWEHKAWSQDGCVRVNRK